MNNEKLNNVLLFIEVINAGSFIGAGKKLGISKASVSRRINQLETSMHSQLIKRTTRTLSMTEEGQILYKACAEIPLTLDTAMRELNDHKTKPSGKLKIGISSPFANNFDAMKLIANFMSAYQDISVECHAVTASAGVDIVHEDFDLYLTSHDLSGSKVKSSLLCEYPVVACASPRYLHNQEKIKSLDDLGSHNCLLHFAETEPVTKWWYLQNKQLKNIEVHGRLHADRSHMLLKMARADLGIALQPLFMAQKYISNGELTILLDHIEFEPAQVFITLYRKRNVSNKLKYFIDYLSSHIKHSN